MALGGVAQTSFPKDAKQTAEREKEFLRQSGVSPDGISNVGSPSDKAAVELKAENARLREENTRLRLMVAPDKLKELDAQLASQRAEQWHGSVAFEDPTAKYEIKLLRIVKGQAAVDAGLMERWELDKARKQNLEWQFFEVSFRNMDTEQIGVSFSSWNPIKLLDDEGNAYDRAVTSLGNSLDGSLEPGQKATGFMLYTVRAGRVPAQLQFKTKYLRRGTQQPIYATVTVPALLRTEGK